MKKTLLTVLLVSATAAAFGQGALNWGTTFGTTTFIPVYGADPASPTLRLTGQSAIGKPSGTTVYGGPLLSGTGYTFGVLAGASSSSLSLIASTTFRTGTGTALPKGLVIGGTATVPGVEPNSPGFYQMVAWDNAGGTILDWASAKANSASWGFSDVFPTGALGGIDPVSGSPITAPNTAGWVSFNITAIPEPATFALAGLGAAALLIFRRRK